MFKAKVQADIGLKKNIKKIMSDLKSVIGDIWYAKRRKRKYQRMKFRNMFEHNFGFLDFEPELRQHFQQKVTGLIREREDQNISHFKKEMESTITKADESDVNNLLQLSVYISMAKAEARKEYAFEKELCMAATAFDFIVPELRDIEDVIKTFMPPDSIEEVQKRFLLPDSIQDTRSYGSPITSIRPNQDSVAIGTVTLPPGSHMD